MRVVVYGEGYRELGESVVLRSRPGDSLPEEGLGAAHWLVRRVLGAAKGLPTAAVRFEEPLRTDRGLKAKGTDLLRKRTLRLLLTWTSLARCPDLAVVFVDEDGNGARRQTLLKSIEGLPDQPPRTIAVPVREFEAWLLSDWQCLQDVLGIKADLPPVPEGLDPRVAKEQFARLLTASTRRDEQGVRLDIARQCSLQRVRERSRSFGRFLADLA